LSNVDINEIEKFVISYYEKINDELLRFNTERYKNMNESFKGQKNNERPELNDVEFTDFLNCAFEGDNYQYLFNKNLIKDFVINFDNTFSTNILNKSDDDSAEFYASKLYNVYIDNITFEEDILIDSKDLLEQLFRFR
jgi:hypothetical protein